MKKVTHLTTDDIRIGYSTAAYDDELANTEFDLWLFKERERVAELATARERAHIIKLLNNDDLVPRLNTPQGNWVHLDTLIALIKGENK